MCERMVLTNDGSGVGYNMKCKVNGTVVEYVNLTMYVDLAVFM